jgi:hypothetical protein
MLPRPARGPGSRKRTAHCRVGGDRPFLRRDSASPGGCNCDEVGGEKPEGLPKTMQSHKKGVRDICDPRGLLRRRDISQRQRRTSSRGKALARKKTNKINMFSRSFHAPLIVEGSRLVISPRGLASVRIRSLIRNHQ